MLFNSTAFLIFLPVVLLGYYVLSTRAQNLWLLIASCVFYAWWDYRFLFLLLIPTVIDYVCALKIHGAPDSARVRRRYLLLSVVTNLTILGFFKYFGFFVDSGCAVLEAFGIHRVAPALGIVLPVGISFYTFHELSYVIDVYRGVLAPVRSPTRYLLYVLYFPQLVAGPIARASRLLPQLTNTRRVGWGHVQTGLLLMLIGYFKKVGIADALAPIVDRRFSDPTVCAGSDLLFALYLFAIQIYCDFSGYTDIARGVSKLFGIELAVNFKHPYFASNISEFWRSWHMSLSDWLRDYLYIPLGGNRGGTLRTYRNLMLTMLLGGLWHGAHWTFVVWGGLHGLYLATHKCVSDRSERTDRPRSGGARILSSLATFHLVAFAWIFFRAKSFQTAAEYIAGIARWQSAGVSAPASALGPRVLCMVLSLVLLELAQYWRGEQAFVLERVWYARGLVYASLAILILVLGGTNDAAPFIYFQF